MGIKMVMSGEGADEALAGYLYFHKARTHPNPNPNPEPNLEPNPNPNPNRTPNLYFHKAPDGKELHEECVRKIDDLHKFDCLRANKATMAHGLEARVPLH